jgi:DNA invertase Pin-like site-specific DNA recombinase
MIKFAFYGRVSTEDQQDPESSRGWQLIRSHALIEARGGVVVTEFFDVDKSRSVPWQRRPQAAALLAELRDARRGFDAVVVGEPHRAFYGNQYGLTIPLFEHYRVPLWVPEVGGPIDPDNEAHDLVMSVFGGMSKGERNRVRIRVRSVMAAQAETEGRFLGGRPPYGYLLADAGPHPNPAKAADGRRLHALAPDPETAWVVRRIFAEYLAGRGYGAIAAGLTGDKILSPSAYDPARNSHRTGTAWDPSAVRSILGNPRYTGRQVWNKQRKTEVLIDVNDVALGCMTKLKWNDPGEWVWSQRPAQEAIVDEDTFRQAQALRSAPGRGEYAPRRTPRPYLLRGILRCGICGRKMQGCWNHGLPHYRCRPQAQETASGSAPHLKSVYLREDRIIPHLDNWLSRKFDPAALPATMLELAGGARSGGTSQAAAALHPGSSGRAPRAGELDPHRHRPVAGAVLPDPAGHEIPGHLRAGTSAALRQVGARKAPVEGVAEQQVPVADYPARLRQHVLPAVQDCERRREGAEAGPHVGQENLDARQAPGAEPVLVECLLGAHARGLVGAGPEGARVLHLQGAPGQPRVHEGRLTRRRHSALLKWGSG